MSPLEKNIDVCIGGHDDSQRDGEYLGVVDGVVEVRHVLRPHTQQSQLRDAASWVEQTYSFL